MPVYSQKSSCEVFCWVCLWHMRPIGQLQGLGKAKTLLRTILMTEQEKIALKAKVRAEIERITRDVAHLEEITRPVKAEDMDEITRMDALINKSVNDAALAASRSRLAGLGYALKRLEDDDPEFGFCLECGDAIPMARLMAMPEASHCVDCAGR